jgi:hypothetical protein
VPPLECSGAWCPHRRHLPFGYDWAGYWEGLEHKPDLTVCRHLVPVVNRVLYEPGLITEN